MRRRRRLCGPWPKERLAGDAHGRSVRVERLGTVWERRARPLSFGQHSRCMESDPKSGPFMRLLEFLGLRKRPPDIGLREPRRPSPSASGGAVALEPPEKDELE